MGVLQPTFNRWENDLSVPDSEWWLAIQTWLEIDRPTFGALLMTSHEFQAQEQDRRRARRG